VKRDPNETADALAIVLVLVLVVAWAGCASLKGTAEAQPEKPKGSVLEAVDLGWRVDCRLIRVRDCDYVVTDGIRGGVALVHAADCPNPIHSGRAVPWEAK
jgi:hypothetical protein